MRELGSRKNGHSLPLMTRWTFGSCTPALLMRVLQLFHRIQRTAKEPLLRFLQPFQRRERVPQKSPNFFFFSCLILSAICRPDLSPAFLLFFIFFFGGVSSSCFLFFTFSSYFSFSSKSVISSECSLSEHPGLKPDMDFIFPAILKRPELMVHPHGLVTYQSPVIGFTLIGGKF